MAFMSNQNWPEAIKSWREALGEDRVVSDASRIAARLSNIGDLQRKVPAILSASSTTDVQNVVRIAGRCGTPVHPISTGKNWGLGSALPVRDGTAVLDLGGMDRIREVNERHHYAVIEPGVTQRRMYEHLRERGLRLLMNVTGSGADTSLLGNSLERGIGYFSSRAESIWSLEVVLGTGEILHTGMSHVPGALTAHHYRHGVGPSLDGLFMQGNLGIVTAAAFDLMPEPEYHATVICKMQNPANLARLVDRLVALRRNHVIRTVVHIGNRHRQEVALGLAGAEPSTRERLGFGAWSAVVGVMGARHEVKSSCRAVRRAVRELADVMVLDDRAVGRIRFLARALPFLPKIAAMKPVMKGVLAHYGLSKGIPTDETLNSLYTAVGLSPPADGRYEPDAADVGMIYCLPVMPADGATAARAVAVAETLFAEYRFAPYVTVNILDSRCVECVVNVSFRRGDGDESVRAQDLMHRVYDAYLREGMIPYRFGVDVMDRIVRADDPFWKTVAELKRVFDPHGVISPGRYNLV